MKHLKLLTVEKTLKLNGGYTCPFGDYSSRNFVKVVTHAINCYRRRKFIVPLEKIIYRVI